jgi:hypothetical protein
LPDSYKKVKNIDESAPYRFVGLTREKTNKEEVVMKKCVMLMAGILAVALAGSAQAATMFAVQDAAATDKMVVTDTGLIGVNVPNPTKAFTAVGVPGAGQAQIQVSTSGVTSAGGGGGGVFYHNGAAGALPNNGDRLGYFLFGGNDGVTPKNAAGLVSRADGTWVSGIPGPAQSGAYFSFETTAVGTTGRTEKMRLSSTGNLGIGTIAPTSKLHVVGIPLFANNAAAITGGLTAGAFYRTGADPDMLCVVH